MPTPKKNESKQDFVSRYMGHSESQKSFPDPQQRLAVAYSVYDEKKKEVGKMFDPMMGLVRKGGPGSGPQGGKKSGPGNFKVESVNHGTKSATLTYEYPDHSTASGVATGRLTDIPISTLHPDIQTAVANFGKLGKRKRNRN